MKSLSWVGVLLICLVSSLGALYIDRNFFRGGNESAYINIARNQEDILGPYLRDSVPSFGASVNFVAAARKVQDAVVYIRAEFDRAPGGLRDMHRGVPGFDDLFEGPGGRGEGSGSGVILTPGGYVVTNHHVVDGAGRIQVTLHNKQRFDARVIGLDPSTDLALLKIEATGLPFVPYGDSDKLRIGEWVLAIGNPFDLTSTVTAGIISGKARNINILREKSDLAIESFLQTDAAVNPGNSGGALVNLRGDLVGINTAIASPTGSYSGYSFAVPANLVKKVVQDLLEFGVVQRGLLGVSVLDVDAGLARDQGFEKIEGVFVRDVNPGSAAEKAGVEKGDVILSVNGRKVDGVPELQEAVGRFRPGEKIRITIRRGNAERSLDVVLTNPSGTTQLSRKSPAAGPVVSSVLGAGLRPVPRSVLESLDVAGAVEIVSLQDGPLKSAGLKEGYLILRVDKKPVSTPAAAEELYRKTDGGVLVEALSPDGEPSYFVLVKPKKP